MKADLMDQLKLLKRVSHLLCLLIVVAANVFYFFLHVKKVKIFQKNKNKEGEGCNIYGS